MHDEVREVERAARPDAQDVEAAEAEEQDDRRHLDPREPVLELAERADGDEVGGGHQRHEAEGEEPERRVEPVGEGLRTGDRLEADDDDPEVPVEPAHREAGPAAEGVPGVVGEGSGAGVRGRHLAEHAHHQDDQHAGDRVGEERAGARAVDHHPGPHEQAGADDAADRDHGELPLREALVQLGRGCHGCLRGGRRSPVGDPPGRPATRRTGRC